MTALKRMDPREIREALHALPQWSEVEGKLRREFRFGDFVEAFGFMTKVAMVAESLGHHPEWFNVYGRVIVELTTHDVGGISALDFEMARRLEALSG